MELLIFFSFTFQGPLSLLCSFSSLISFLSLGGAARAEGGSIHWILWIHINENTLGERSWEYEP